MRRTPIHALALLAVMQWGIAQAQDSGEGIIPPSPDEAGATAQPADPPIDAEAPALDSPQPEVGQDTEALPDPASQTEAGQAMPDVHQSDPAASDKLDEPEISDHVRRATANLDIDDQTRSRYRWKNGEWWYQTKAGTWKYHRDGEWQAFDPTSYQPPETARSSDGGMMLQSGPPTTFSEPNYPARSSYPVTPQPERRSMANGYTYDAPSYRPVPPRTYYGGGYGYDRYGYNDRYYRGQSYGTPYGAGYRGGYGGTYYNPRNDTYYGRGPYGGGYSVDGDRYRGGMIGSQIGGQIGGQTGAILGGAIGAEAAD